MSQGDNWLEGGNPHSQGMSGGTKVLLGFLVFGGICALVCCGGVGFVYYKFKEAVDMTVAPAEVEARAQEIVQFKAPARFQPAMAMKVKANGGSFNVVTYHAAAVGGSMTISETSTPFEEAKDHPEEALEEIKEMQRDKAGAPAVGVGSEPAEPAAPGESMEPAEAESPETPPATPDVKQNPAETKERVIRGQKVTVHYSKDFNPGTGKHLRSMHVVVPGKTPGTSAIVRLMVPEAAWDDAEVEALLDSLQ